MTRRSWTWLAVVALTPLTLLALLALWLAVFGWNWARAPLQAQALQRTGRVLHIAGDLTVRWAWPLPHLRAQGLTFANPPWASEPQMVVADSVDVSVDMPALLHGQLAFPSVQLVRPRVFLEQASGGRKTWLLDLAQTDEAVRVPIGRVLLDQGEITYTDTARATRVHATLSTVENSAAAPAANGGARSLVFSADGRLLGQPLQASGSGGAVLAWRDESTPYPLQVKATLGATRVQAEGTVTGLFQLTAMDLKLALVGDSLAALYPLIGVALPPTPSYSSSGRFVRSGRQWRYENFAGRIGDSDIAGSLQVDTGGPRNKLTGALVSKQLSLADLGPAVGSRMAAPEGGAPQAKSKPAPTRMLPDIPFDTERWASLDADVTLRAQTLLRDKALPLDRLQFHLLLQDGVLTLDPLAFELAGGELQGLVTLDSRKAPMLGRARLQLRGLLLGRLLPTVDLSKNSIGQLNGDIELAGQGATVGQMLATASGRVSLVAQNGRISRLLMEQTGLHLIEILQLTLAGDQTVGLRCAVADFGVIGGVMQARALVLDTDVNTLTGSGQVNLGDESLALTIVPRTKVSSVVALRSPVYVKGTFSQPQVALDTGRILTRGAGALALGLVNPLLALIPLFDAGPGVNSPCQQLVVEAKAPLPPVVKRRRTPAAAR
jgi:AsmA protein